jgi:archaemetzincin
MFQILLVPIGSVDSNVVQWLSVALTDSLQFPCTISSEPIDPAETFHSTRRQYNSTQLLAKLVSLKCGSETKVLGVAGVDLFIPILTFVFGEAQLGKQAALISIHRLKQSFYGLPDSESLLYERCEKEAIHELGHAFGLIHCERFDCVMHFSNSIEQVDLKSNTFCNECARSIPGF